MNITTMNAWMEPQVRKLYAECHPTWEEPSPYWFYAYPTLVIVEHGEVIAYTSYGMNTNDDGVLAIFLQDTGVAPSARGRGLSRELMKARLGIGQSMGAKYALGMTQPDNKPMLGLLRSMGFREVAVAPNVYANKDGILFILDLTETATWQ